ncbi:N-acetylmuramoyl-L-alanine amidase [Roseimicrobium gellanilyticum]|uniref:N-acetylmuramoyl-L-alanine amidase n=1 Tax=Roseimicrobium gellanilyticum TaxID=748857 RepID=A0A366HQF8_9BACT|nr:N-acetylmuramoyl-L-alanine amidase [Roseimicrobium gellanilyticum]RBP45089.1 N-acetylmuramoyl-L-alanine amidase [Roseimicrobium gellanilyticum]
MRPLRLVLPLAVLAVLVVIVGCESSSRSSRSRSGSWDSQLGAVPVERKVAPVALLGEVRLRQDMIRPGTVGRRYKRPMNVRYITIHSTQNYTGDAYNHALALKRGALRAQKRRGGNRIGFLTWHFTVQDNVAIQHLPTNEQGEHADFDGPGNNYSIGIEMCEHRGNNLAQTIDRTAKLTAYLMYEHGLSIDRVVPHYHWPRRGLNPPNKNCPHFLLENGRPGATWRWFKARVQAHYNRIVPGPVPRI